MLFRHSLLLLTPILPACAMITAVPGSGTILTETRETPGFQSIDVSGSANVFLTQGPLQALTIECDDNLLPHIRSEVVDGTLRLGFERGSWSPSQTTIYRITAPEISGIEVSGAVNLRADAWQADLLDIQASGSTEIAIDQLQARSLQLRTSGASRITLASWTSESVRYEATGSSDLRATRGQVGQFEALCSGSSDIDMLGVQTQSATLRLSGSSDAQLWVEGQLTSRASGSASVRYRGTPTVQANVSGSGSVQPIGE
ncbi:MAG: DUF2807 domain-containing protein [Planctomycetes bacterium]|nr:DUF2807 domain-containing protein [Planctomycetota bacterium]